LWLIVSAGAVLALNQLTVAIYFENVDMVGEAIDQR
jgi:hypothetical protein